MNQAVPVSSQGLLAVFWMLVSTVCFSGMHAMIRYVASGTEDTIHPLEIAFFRNFFGVVALAPLFLRYGLQPLKTNRIGLLSLRAVVNTGAMMLFFMALASTPLATVSALGFSAPLFATLLAMLFLGEKVRFRRWAAILFGFAGTLVILRPGFGAIEPGMLMVLASSSLWACALIIIKVLSRTESSLTITFYMVLLMLPLSAVPAVFVWTWPTPEQWLWLAAIGTVGTFAQLSMTQALKLGETSTVMPLDFFKLIWASVIGYILFTEIPDVFTWIGGLMIFAGATYIVIRESELRRKRPAETSEPVSR